jgi:hypothetical protein
MAVYNSQRTVMEEAAFILLDAWEAGAMSYTFNGNTVSLTDT